MTTWLDRLNDAWNELAHTAPVARQYRSRLISTEVHLEVRAGMRALDNAPCLILQTPLSPEALFELGGMRLSSVRDDDGPLLILSLEDSGRRDLFATICADVAGVAALAHQDDALDQFLARLDAWRQFLRDRSDGLSRHDTVGLIGELLVLERLLAINPHRLACWESPADGLQDFRAGGHALEAKASLGPATGIMISRLDQLDTSGLNRLDLLHVRLIEAPEGRCLRDIISTLNTVLPDDLTRHSFENALLRRGLLPDDGIARSTPRVQLRSIDAYSISDGFPRLVRSAIHPAVIEATYTLEVRAIAAFAEDTTAVLDAFIQGAAT